MPQNTENESIPVEVASDKPTFTSPEGVLMLFIAVSLDTAGWLNIVLLGSTFSGVGEIISWIIDITAFAIIGSWAYFRFKKIAVKKQLVKKIGVKFGSAAIVEVIPIIGDLCPSWTILVISLLK